MFLLSALMADLELLLQGVRRSIFLWRCHLQNPVCLVWRYGPVPAFGEWLSGVGSPSLPLTFVFLSHGPVWWCFFTGICAYSGLVSSMGAQWCVGSILYRRRLLCSAFIKELTLVLRVRIRMEAGFALRVVGVISFFHRWWRILGSSIPVALR